MVFRSRYDEILAARMESHHAVIHMYEKAESAFRYLPQADHTALLLVYMDALFATGRYQDFANRIEDTILRVLDGDHPSAVFHHLLYRKAAAHYHLREIDQAEHVLLQLIRIAPRHPLASRFLTKCRYEAGTQRWKRLREWTLAMAGLSIFALILTLLFQPEHPGFRVGWLVLVILTAGIWMGGLAIFWWKARLQTDHAISAAHLRNIRTGHDVNVTQS